MEYTEDEMLLAAIENTVSDLIDIFVKLKARDLVDGLVKSNEGKEQ